MSILSYVNEKNETLYKVYIVVRSPENRDLRIQKRKNGIKTRIEAERVQKQLLAEANREISIVQQRGKSWEFLVNSWEKYLCSGAETGIGKLTARDYPAILKLFTNQWNSRVATSITPHDLKLVIDEMTKKGLSNSRKHYLMSAINGMFKWAIDGRLIDSNSVSPTFGIRVSKKSANKPEILTLEEIRKFLETAPTSLAHF